jgi:hypothetical protein
MSNLVDTLLNITVFVFIGLLVWIYVKPARTPDNAGRPKR